MGKAVCGVCYYRPSIQALRKLRQEAGGQPGLTSKTCFKTKEKGEEKEGERGKREGGRVAHSDWRPCCTSVAAAEGALHTHAEVILCIASLQFEYLNISYF